MNKIIMVASIVLIYLLLSFVVSKIFRKANKKWYLAFIPVVNFIVLLNIAGLKWYYIFEFALSLFIGLFIYFKHFKDLSLIVVMVAALVAFVYYYINLNIRVGKKFNKGKLFLLFMIIPIIPYIILAFDKSEYKDNEIDTVNNKFLHILVTVLVIVVSSASMIPLVFNSITKGLDLAGGFEILYQISPSEKGQKLTSSDVEDTYRTMLRRIDKLGVSEPELTIEGKDKIRVKLAGVTDPEAARDYITVAGELSFRDSKDNKLMDKSVLSNGTAAKISKDDNGNPAILLNIKNKDLFYNVTSKISQTEDKLIVIWLDFVEGQDKYSTATCGEFKDLNEAKCLSAATVSQGFSSNVIIQGNFTEEQVQNLVDLINSGSNNVKFKEISSQTVGSAFGEDSLLKTEIAGVIGIVLIIVFMTIIYRYSGLIASSVILVYTFMTFLVFKGIDGVLTLPGIAALVLGIGMAVDANVITCERIKEELRKGRELKQAYKNGIKNSFSSILDSNVTTFIIAVILFIFGESSVKGFATMLIINIIMTMLIVVLITRLITYGFINSGFFNNRLKMFINQSKKEIVKTNEAVESKFEKRINKDYVKHLKKFIILPALLFIVSIVFVFVKGFNFGIDFTGGTDITITNAKKTNLSTIKKEVKTLGYTVIDSSSDDSGYYIKISEILDKDDIKKVNNVFESTYKAKTDISVVSNLVKKDLIKNAIIALIYAIIGIIIYISIRYKFSYAISSVIALFHDVFMIVAMFAILRLEINSIFIAAILTIIGYSINNTIVIFDRIRENKKKLLNENNLSREELVKVANTSIKQTMLRSINTTITTMLPIICLIIYGSKEIVAFDIAIFIGLIAGAYSSIFMSSSIWVFFENKINSRKNKMKKNPKKNNKPKKKKVEELSVKGINA